MGLGKTNKRCLTPLSFYKQKNSHLNIPAWMSLLSGIWETNWQVYRIQCILRLDSAAFSEIQST